MAKLSKPGKNLPNRLLRWFDNWGRTLPWRQGAPRNPYLVWLSEIMLQQTTVAAVIPYFEKFIKLYPDVYTLANASKDEVLSHWAGLGYYARARNLHKCAKIIASDFGGIFPKTEAGLKALPGIGPYTAAAILAIAFGQPTTVVDGNIERIMARLFRVKDPWPKSKKKLHALAKGLTPELRPGDYAEALMDLGATICTTKAPDCPACPLQGDCLAFQEGLQTTLPIRERPREKPTRRGIVFWLEDNGHVLVQRRPDKGLLGGMLEFPSTPWGQEEISPGAAKPFAPVKTEWHPVAGEVRHTFTHFHLRLKVLKGVTKATGHNGQWLREKDLINAGFPTVMKKVAQHVLGEKKI